MHFVYGMELGDGTITIVLRPGCVSISILITIAKFPNSFLLSLKIGYSSLLSSIENDIVLSGQAWFLFCLMLVLPIPVSDCICQKGSWRESEGIDKALGKFPCAIVAFLGFFFLRLVGSTIYWHFRIPSIHWVDMPLNVKTFVRFVILKWTELAKCPSNLYYTLMSWKSSSEGRETDAIW